MQAAFLNVFICQGVINDNLCTADICNFASHKLYTVIKVGLFSLTFLILPSLLILA